MDTRSERPRPAAHGPEALRRAALALRQAQALEAGDEDLAAAAACLEAAVRELGPLADAEPPAGRSPLPAAALGGGGRALRRRRFRLH